MFFKKENDTLELLECYANKRQYLKGVRFFQIRIERRKKRN